jgi:hypothetical protein
MAAACSHRFLRNGASIEKRNASAPKANATAPSQLLSAVAAQQTLASTKQLGRGFVNVSTRKVSAAKQKKIEAI